MLAVDSDTNRGPLGRGSKARFSAQPCWLAGRWDSIGGTLAMQKVNGFESHHPLFRKPRSRGFCWTRTFDGWVPLRVPSQRVKISEGWQ